MKNGFRVMDSDIHVIEPPDMYERYLEDRFKPQAPIYAPPLPGKAQGDWLIQLPGQKERITQIFPFPAKPGPMEVRKQQQLPVLKDAIEDNYGPATHLKAMDIEGIDVAIAFTTRSRGHVSMDDLDPEYAIAICRAFNNYLADFCKEAPDRLKGCALISLHSVDLAVEEARRAVKDLGMVGLTLLPNPVKGRFLHDPECDPLWREAQELNVPICFHDTNGGYHRGHLANFLRHHPNAVTMTQTFGFSLSLMQAIGSFIVGGVLERFPRLRVAFLEGNCSWLPWLLWRLEEQWEMYGESEEIPLSMKATDYFLRQCYISVEPEETPAKMTVSALGDSNLVISTDYPHADSSYPHAIDTFLELPGLSRETQQKVLWDNCARLYNL